MAFSRRDILAAFRQKITDGVPIIGKVDHIDGMYLGVGMCGQGFMLGPGMAEVIYRVVTEDYHEDDPEILENFNPYRDFTGQEVFR